MFCLKRNNSVLNVYWIEVHVYNSGKFISYLYLGLLLSIEIMYKLQNWDWGLASIYQPNTNLIDKSMLSKN